MDARATAIPASNFQEHRWALSKVKSVYPHEIDPGAIAIVYVALDDFILGFQYPELHCASLVVKREGASLNPLTNPACAWASEF
jgi:hypothetical protein